MTLETSLVHFVPFVAENILCDLMRPGSNRPVLFVNQNLDVIAGSIKASYTSGTDLRMSIAAFATVD